MPPVPESPTGPDFTVRVVEDDGRSVANANDYDSFAEAYTAETEANLINGYYVRPAILDLAGDVAGRRILDAGCGSGASPRRYATGAPPNGQARGWAWR